MTMTAEQIARVIEELQPLVGARIQRVDVVAEREVVLELRVPGRTLRMLLSARPQLGAVCLVSKRPKRLVPPGQLQAILRARLLGQPVMRLECAAHTIILSTRRMQIRVRIDGGKAAFELLDPPSDLPDLLQEIPIPEVFTLAQEFGAQFAEHAPQEADRVLRTALGKVLKARRKKLSRLEAKLEGDRSKHAKHLEAASDGELLKAELYKVKRGDAQAEVMDWTTGTTRIVVLDPKLNPQRNLERLFARVKKAKRGLPRVEGRLGDLKAKLQSVDAQIAKLEAADSETLEAWSKSWNDDLESPKSGRSARKTTKKVHPLDKWSREFLAVDGTSIRVGKGATANDRLTFSGAKGDDIWLHARGTTGAHVILSNKRGTSPSPEALLDAAHLAAHYSSSKNDSKVEVMHTEARHVKKTKGAAAGSVGVAKSKTMLVGMDASRLDRLLGRTGGAVN